MEGAANVSAETHDEHSSMPVVEGSIEGLHTDIEIKAEAEHVELQFSSPEVKVELLTADDVEIKSLHTEADTEADETTRPLLPVHYMNVEAPDTRHEDNEALCTSVTVKEEQDRTSLQGEAEDSNMISRPFFIKCEVADPENDGREDFEDPLAKEEEGLPRQEPPGQATYCLLLPISRSEGPSSEGTPSHPSTSGNVVDVSGQMPVLKWNKMYPCCGNLYHSRALLKRHLEEVHYGCGQCGKPFHSAATLKAHLQAHAEERSLTCKQCGQTFSHKDSLMQHIQEHRGVVPYTCEECSVQFLSKRSLKHHFEHHSGAKPFKCKQCGAWFKEDAVLRLHMKYHEQEEPHRCLDCGRRFRTLEDLQNHQSVHNKFFLCGQCLLPFYSKQGLASHMKCHTAVTNAYAPQN